MPASIALRRLPAKGSAKPSLVLSSFEYVSWMVLPGIMVSLGAEGLICGVL